MPRVGNLEALYLIAHHLSKNPMKWIVFNLTEVEVNECTFRPTESRYFYWYVVEEDLLNMPEPLGKYIVIQLDSL